ncbi:UNVERIFIED_CONTAM: hypothetical protein GTU68_037708 [Idotea baltica]|nr:hypothetical protein [Idotea baltica]
MNKKEPNNVIIFDGVCSLCNAWVDFVLRKEKEDIFSFAANQSDEGQAILEKFNKTFDNEEVDTVFLLENGQLYERSTAALRIVKKLSFPWNLAYGFVVIPRPIRDFFYKIIAKNRYRWFGKKNSCRLPTPEERAKFIGW